MRCPKCEQEYEPPVPELDAKLRAVVNRLNRREKRMAARVGEGWINRDIAAELGTTEQVVKNALRKVFDRFGVSTRTELAIWLYAHPPMLDVLRKDAGLE